VARIHALGVRAVFVDGGEAAVLAAVGLDFLMNPEEIDVLPLINFALVVQRSGPA